MSPSSLIGSNLLKNLGMNTDISTLLGKFLYVQFLRCRFPYQLGCLVNGWTLRKKILVFSKWVCLFGSLSQVFARTVILAQLCNLFPRYHKFVSTHPKQYANIPVPASQRASEPARHTLLEKPLLCSWLKIWVTNCCVVAMQNYCYKLSESHSPVQQSAIRISIYKKYTLQFDNIKLFQFLVKFTNRVVRHSTLSL